MFRGRACACARRLLNGAVYVSTYLNTGSIAWFAVRLAAAVEVELTFT